MADETTPDAVAMLQWMHACAVHSENHGDVPHIGSDEVLAVLRATQDERARHAEEVARLRDVHLDETRALDDLRLKEIASLRDQLRRTEGARDVATRVAADHFGTICQLRDQLRKAEGERDAEREHATEMEERALDLVRDLRLAQVELTSIRSLLPDVRECAEYVIGEFPENHPAALTGSRILAALDSQGGEGE